MPLKRTGYIYQQLQAVSGISAQVFSYLDRPEEKSEQPGGVALARFSGEIVFDNVGFAYDGDSGSVLQDIQFRARRVEVIALGGLSGAGKTTVVHLLLTFLEPSPGAISSDEG